MKKSMSIALIIILLITFISPVSTADTPSRKEEVIYGLLNPDGSVNNIYVVNIFDGGAVTDYGHYSEIRNLTSSEKIDINGDEITINTNADKFYYQGTLKNRELPWNIEIKYFLNNKEVPGKDLAGKSGKLDIHISVKQNNKVNSFFFNNFALQISISFDSNLCSNIKADGATIALAGNTKQITYTVLPGKGTDIAISADVHDFEMEPISINAIRLALDIDIDVNEFTKELSALANAIRELDDGASELFDGISQLSSGMENTSTVLKLKDGLEQLSGGADTLYEGALAFKSGLTELTKQNDVILNGALAIQKATLILSMPSLVAWDWGYLFSHQKITAEFCLLILTLLPLRNSLTELSNSLRD